MQGALSRSIHELSDRCGVVIVGSGYGGSIVAARLAQLGHSVCLLERGREWLPGEFPDELGPVLDERRADDRPLGLYEYHVGRDVDVFGGNGLGGGSLINAAVVFEPGPEVFRSDRWPRTIRDEAEDGRLRPYFARVREALGTVPFPDDLDRLPKVRAHAESARRVERPLRRLDLAINLRRDASVPNEHGVHQRPCTLCGDCVAGCNVGAKNTLTTTYLPMAARAGAAIFTRIEVDHVAAAPGGGYFVYARHYLDPRSAAAEPLELHARVVVIAAGVLGSAGILLRSRARGLPLSPRLGRFFSTNGDLIGFAYNTDVLTDAVGFGAAPGRADPGYQAGPTITSAVDYRSGAVRAGDFVIEDGAIPRSLTTLFRATAPEVALVTGVDTDGGLRDKVAEVGRVLRDVVAPDGDGAMRHSMVYLAIGHDGADGRVVLDEHGKPRIEWEAAGERLVFRRMSDEMLRLTGALGGTYFESPRWQRWAGKSPVTVHPLGGCPMGDDVDRGVVDHGGQVRAPGGDGQALHEGLFVADGSIIPTSLGVNPLLTIGALAERIAEQIHARAGAAAIRPQAGPIEPPRPASAPRDASVELSEEMRGFVSAAVTTAATPAEYREAERRAVAEKSYCDLRLTIAIDDVDAFVAPGAHAARAEGTVDAVLLGRKLVVDEGTFQLFVSEGGDPRRRRMIYDLKLRGEDDEPYRLHGVKLVEDDPGFDAWTDVTTLYTTLHRGWTKGAPVLAQGVLHLHPSDVLAMIPTFRGSHSAIATLGRFFFGALWEVFGGG